MLILFQPPSINLIHGGSSNSIFQKSFYFLFIRSFQSTRRHVIHFVTFRFPAIGTLNVTCRSDKELGNMDRDTFHYITGVKNFVSLKWRSQCITVLVYGNRNLEINHNGRFPISLLNNMSQLKYLANKQNTTQVNKQINHWLIEISLSSLLLFISS